MATLRDTVRTTLSGDATLSAILTGGVLDWDSISGSLGLTLENIPKAADGVTALPTGVIVWRNRTAIAGLRNDPPPEGVFFEFWAYHPNSYATLETAMQRAKALLHEQVIAPTDNRGGLLVRWIDDLGDFIASELGNLLADRSRYFVMTTRK